MEEKIQILKKWIDESQNIVFFGGAGVSTLSGIPDFRSVNGLYNQKYPYPPEIILSHTFFKCKTKEFFRFYFDKMLYLDAKPNIVHKKLAEWENQGKMSAVITQNIDGLHQAAGSKKVYELHGSVYRNYCIKCGKFYKVEQLGNFNDIPKCNCGGVIKPNVVLYEESLDDDILNAAMKAISNADVFIVAGTSLAVYPAAGLTNFYNKDKFVLINREKTLFDDKANLVIHMDMGEIFANL
ncbi:MAG TPA: NAD-dependent protein deacylase [Clostridia bacterium]|nr:NAD-dependent protein deacylase [Clostridia bacterium]